MAEETKKAAKKSTAKTSASRYSYADVVKSNEEVRDAITALADLIRSDTGSVDTGGIERMLAEQLAAIREISSKPATETPQKASAEAAILVTESLAEQKRSIDELLTAVRGNQAKPEEGSQYLTSREQFDIYSKIIGRHDAEFADKQFTTMMEQICAMREDYKRLCAGMEQNIDNMSAKDVLSSFKCYQVDLDNMLKDAGVRFGAFGTQGQKADPAFQRIVGVVPTDDPAQDGTVAKRLSSGYEYKGKAVYKERVMIYRSKKD